MLLLKDKLLDRHYFFPLRMDGLQNSLNALFQISCVIDKELLELLQASFVHRQAPESRIAHGLQLCDTLLYKNDSHEIDQ